MVSKRRLGASLLLLGLAFVGAGLAGVSVLALLVVNLPALGK